jgi:hypothetical protein
MSDSLFVSSGTRLLAADSYTTKRSSLETAGLTLWPLACWPSELTLALSEFVVGWAHTGDSIAVTTLSPITMQLTFFRCFMSCPFRGFAALFGLSQRGLPRGPNRSRDELDGL